MPRGLNTGEAASRLAPSSIRPRALLWRQFDFATAERTLRRTAAKDARVDAYIAKSADFAKPILSHIRKAVHAACPNVEETMKWSFPHFDYKGMLCSMAAFKNHCSFGFWKGELILGKRPGGLAGEGMGHFGRITALSDLPPEKVLIG